MILKNLGIARGSGRKSLWKQKYAESTDLHLSKILKISPRQRNENWWPNLKVSVHFTYDYNAESGGPWRKCWKWGARRHAGTDRVNCDRSVIMLANLKISAVVHAVHYQIQFLVFESDSECDPESRVPNVTIERTKSICDRSTIMLANL